MTEILISKPENLETRTFRFAENTRDFIKTLPRTITSIEYAKQLARSSGSVAANYIEANESLSKKDFLLQLRISRKECKETRPWLKLLKPDCDNAPTCRALIEESTELLKILSAIIEKTVNK